jgi:endonuclease YncB( thermonuclease family)
MRGLEHRRLVYFLHCLLRHGRILALALCALSAGGAAAQQACPLEPAGAAEVAAVRDGRTLMLRDGRELRLAAIETPGANRAAAAQAALAALADGRGVTLKRLGKSANDRYGRLVAFAFVAGGGQSLQQALLSAGEAMVSARVGDKACAGALLALEGAARAQRRGLWADPNFAPLPAENLQELGAKRGQFALVEGKILSVHESGATIYLNFGPRWTRDFTVIVLKRQQRAFAAAGVATKALEGRRIRVRGWIERRGGPVIEAFTPEQIELLE